MMLEFEPNEILPRLLDLDDSPPASQRRRYWQYVHRWQKRLFYLWRQDCPDKSGGAEIARGVDDLLAISLLLDYLQRTEHVEFPSVRELHQYSSHPTPATIATAIAAIVKDSFLSVVLDPQTFADTLPIPCHVVADNWQHRLRNATWILYRDRKMPLSFFGDFHQVCTGNPLNIESPDLKNKGKRRERGMFYTPAPIVDYLVATTLSPLLNDRQPEGVLQLRILDPSCGCGAFLIACFRYISVWLENHPDCDSKTACRLSLEVIEHVLHGCDIDPDAVKWTIRLQLLAAREMLRNHVYFEKTESMWPVPSLHNTIRCKSFLDLARFQSLKSSSSSSYDAILGGPPFVRLEKLHNAQPDRLLLYRRRYLSARQGQYDLYMLFIEQALDLLTEGGRVAFSLANSFLRTDSGRIVRGYIAANASVEEIVEFEDPKTYDDAATQIALLRLRKVRPRCVGRYAVIEGRGRLRHKLEQLASGQPDSKISTTFLSPAATASSQWNLASSEDNSWLETIRDVGIPLGQLVTVESGLSTGIDRLLLLKKTGRDILGSVLTKSRDNSDGTIRLEETAIRSVVRGHQLRGYQPPKLQHVHPYPYRANGHPLLEDDLRVRFPLMHAYLSSKQAELSMRKLAKGCPWYSTFIRLPKDLVHSPRLMSAKITSGNGFSIINDSQLLAHCSVVVLADYTGKIDPYYLLGILNSKVFTRYVSLTMPKINEGRYSLRLSRLRQFPIPDPTCKNTLQASQAISSLVHDLVQRSLSRPPSQELMEDIDRRVADLYGVDP